MKDAKDIKISPEMYAHRGIVPITFIGDELEVGESTNSLFTAPYNSLTAMHEATVECGDLKKLGTKENYQLYMASLAAAKVEAIRSYLVMNLYNLTYDTIVEYTYEIFKSSLTDYSPIDIVGIITNPLIGEDKLMDIHQLVSEAVDDAICRSVTMRHELIGNDLSANHLILSNVAEMIFSYMITNCFNRYINLVIDRAVKTNNFTPIFESIYTELYGKDGVEEAQGYPAVMVEFVGGYMRAAMESYMFRYRAALDFLTHYSSKGFGGNSNESSGEDSRRINGGNPKYKESDCIRG